MSRKDGSQVNSLGGSSHLALHGTTVCAKAPSRKNASTCGSRQTARVKTYGDVITEYEFHPEAKCADAFGNICDRQTVGLLQRRHIKIDLIKCIGKESNSLESVDQGLEHSENNVYTEYADPKRGEWVTKLQPALKRAKAEKIDKGVRKETLAAGNHRTESRAQKTASQDPGTACGHS